MNLRKRFNNNAWIFPYISVNRFNEKHLKTKNAANGSVRCQFLNQNYLLALKALAASTNLGTTSKASPIIP